MIFCCYFNQKNKHQKVVKPKAICSAINSPSISLEPLINEYEEDSDVEELYIQHPVANTTVGADATKKEDYSKEVDQDEQNDMIAGQIMNTVEECCTR